MIPAFPCDLEKYFGALARRLPSRPKERFVFKPETFKAIPKTLSTTRLILLKLEH